MIKKSITFDDLDGNPITEDFYFNLSKAEIAEMELSQEGGMSAHLKKMIDANDGKSIIASFKEILTKSVGKRNPDGKRFDKSEEIILDFVQSDAYSVLFMDLIGDSDSITTFIRGLIPADLAEKLDIPNSNKIQGRPVLQDHQVRQLKTVQLPTEIVSSAVETAKASGMSLDEMREAIRKAEENNPS